MPLDPSRAGSQTPTTVGIGAYDRPDPTFIETLGAALRQENLIGSALSRATDLTHAEMSRVDRNYNVFDDIDGYEEYADRFEAVYNREAAQVTKARIDREKNDRETLAASGWAGVGLSMLASVADPTVLIPGGAVVKAGRIGYSGIRSAAAIGGAAAAATGIQEAGLHASQELRTGAESTVAIGGSAILGGLIGSTASRFFTKQEWGRVSKALEEDLSGEVPNPREVTQTIVSRMQSAGAAAVDYIKLDDLGVGGPRAAQAVARATAAARINPGIETMMSPSRRVRETYARMVDNPVYTSMNMEGRTLGADVENLVKQHQRGALGKWIASSRKLYREAKKSGYRGTATEFNEAIARAGRRGDVDPDRNEFVTRAAQEARSIVFDPLLVRAKQAGLLPEDVQVTTAASYVTRLWNRQRLIGEEDRFREIARNYFRGQIARVPDEGKPDFVSADDMDDYIELVVTSVFNNLTGKGKGDIPEWIVPVTRGPLKERTFNIPDELIEDFLENDMEMILRRYTRTMGAEVELADKFGRADMKEQFEEIAREYEDLRAAAKSPEERERLHRIEKRDTTNLAAFRDMIRGTYRAAEEGSDWSRLTRAALTWNYIRLLGGVTLTSLADTSRLIGVYGMRATMREALPALTRNLKAAKIAVGDAKDLGAVTERVLQSRLATLADLNDPYAHGSKIDRMLSNASNGFSKLTLLGYWNDTMKTIASVMTQNRMMRNALDWDGAGTTERAYMAYLGIDEDMANRIAGQFRKHGMEQDGIYGANVSDWDDDLAARAWGAALNKDVDRTIISKGVADTPLWTKTNWGRLIFQFKSFMLASHQRILIAGLQERPHRFAEQMLFGTAMGMMISYLKMIERGDEAEANRLLDNPGTWIGDGLDRSGIFSVIYDVTNTADKVVSSYGGPNIGLSRVFGEVAGDENAGGGSTRYASRNATGAVGGPTLGVIEDLANIAASVGKQDFTKGTVNAMIRQVPGTTLPGIRTAIHVGIKPTLQDAVQ